MKSNPIPLRERIEHYIAACPSAISGQHGHDRTFRVACILVQGFDLSPEDAFSFLARYNQRCEPPWTERELEHKLRDADRAQGYKPRGYLLQEETGLVESDLRQKTHNDSAALVPAVPRDAQDASQRVIYSFQTSSSLNRQLTERELAILHQAGAEHDPIILEAIRLFNATVVSCSQKPFTRAEPNPEIETSPGEVQAELNL
jgi:hypothetical protein